MLTFSIVWLTLVAAVTLMAMKTKSHAISSARVDVEPRESGRGVALLAGIYALALLAGFLYVGKFLISNL